MNKPSVAPVPVESHRVNGETRKRMAQAILPKGENEGWKDIGQCLFRARHWLGWTLEELSGQLPPANGSETRDSKQVARWERGEERPQVDVIMRVKELRQPFAVQMAKLSGARTLMRAEFEEVA